MRPASIEIGGYVFDRADYDAEGDVLYLARGDREPASEAGLSPEGHGVRYGANGAVIGVTIINARFILRREGHITITLPHEFRVDERALAPLLGGMVAPTRLSVGRILSRLGRCASQAHAWGGGHRAATTPTSPRRMPPQSGGAVAMAPEPSPQRMTRRRVGSKGRRAGDREMVPSTPYFGVAQGARCPIRYATEYEGEASRDWADT